MTRNIKKITIIFIILLNIFHVYASDITYILKKNSYIFNDETIYNFNLVSCEKQGGQISDALKVLYKEGNNYYSKGGMGDYLDSITVSDENGKQFTVLLENIKRCNLLSARLAEISNTYWISSYYFDVLKSNNKNILFNKEKGWIKDWSPSTDETLSESILPTLFYISENHIYIASYSTFGLYFLIDSDSENDNSIVLNCYSSKPNDRYKFTDKNDFIRKIDQKEHFSLIITFDGDYMNLYEGSTNELLGIFVRIEKDDYGKITDKIQRIVDGNRIITDDIIWPRHADGSCDYDGSSLKKQATVVSTSTTRVTFTNVSPNKSMVVAENLKLRSGEATSTQVLTVMQAGTKVKILELGKAETIDGINSNWVKVEVQAGAKDRDGKPIKAGTVGWCYGGYLK